jgi:hypothetical protein
VRGFTYICARVYKHFYLLDLGTRHNSLHGHLPNAARKYTPIFAPISEK